MHPKNGPTKKSEQAKSAAVAGPSSGVLMLARLLLALACAISIYLAYSSFTSSSVAGCGIDSDCHSVLNSKWAYLGPIPVSVPAAVLYIVALIASFKTRPGKGGWPALIMSAGACAIIGAAIWFSAVQLFVLKRLCPYCMAAHLAGALASILLLREGKRLGWFREKTVMVGSLGGIAAIGVLLLIQIASANKESFQQSSYAAATATTENSQALTSAVAQASATNVAVVAAVTNPVPIIQAAKTATPVVPPVGAATSTNQYLLPIIQGMFTLDLRQLPVEGSKDAPHKLVKLFDFTCHHCRDLHHQLEQVQAAFPGQIALVMLPVPLDANCNAIVKRTPSAHVNACEYASIGLAVSRIAPEKFAQFSKWIFEPARPPSVQETRNFAAQLVGTEELEKELATQTSSEQIQANIAIYKANSTKGKSGSLPQLIFPTGASFGSIKKMEDLYGLMNQHYGLSASQ
ncbi:MAG: vitamin K epoxide reductase family protein [Verrucomicrobiales bacterium]